MLDLVGESAQCIVAEFRHFVAEVRRFVAYRMGAATKPIGDPVQHGGHDRPGAFGNLCRARWCAVANAFQLLLQQPQAPFDFTDIGEYRTGMTSLTKHGAPPSKREKNSSLTRITLYGSLVHGSRPQLRKTEPRVSANFFGSGVLETTMGKSGLTGDGDSLSMSKSSRIRFSNVLSTFIGKPDGGIYRLPLWPNVSGELKFHARQKHASHLILKARGEKWVPKGTVSASSSIVSERQKLR
jgi:hypothetical protein